MIRLAALALLALAPTLAEARTIAAAWTPAAERAFVTRRAKGEVFQLPEVRAYDGEGRLLFRLMPAGRGTVAALENALARPAPIAGPPLATALSALQLADGSPVAPAVGRARLVIVDYWATWCAPCKAVSADLDRFMARRGDDVVLVRAETDFVAALRRAGAN